MGYSMAGAMRMFRGGSYVRQGGEKVSRKFDIKGGVAEALASEMQGALGGTKKEIRESRRYKSFLALISRQAKRAAGKEFTKFQLITFSKPEGGRGMRVLMWHGPGKEDYYHFARPKGGGAGGDAWIGSSPAGASVAIGRDGSPRAVGGPTVPIR